jgi:hypothetical protein
MEMVVNAFALNMASEEAIAPRQSMVGWLMRKVTGARRLPSHILAITDLF